ncbi:hypothetical protein NUW54_g8083 [Trametes sanguinea]|nr:hypothetical protein NUW54_g8083 [Trametes sanguinea]
MYQTEARLRTNLLGEPAKHVRPLSETRAIENGANALAEGFLFAVAASLILAETWRSSRNQTKRRDAVDDSLESLQAKIEEMNKRIDMVSRQNEERLAEEAMRHAYHALHDELARILQRVVEIGLRGGWAEFRDTPLPLPRVELVKTSSSSPSQNSEQDSSSASKDESGSDARPSS